jgi:predicted alpha/beta-fold hydrolase
MPWDVEHALKVKTNKLDKLILNINEFLCLQSTSVRQFDARFTCKQFGYSDVDEYYQAATLHTKLDRIRVPTLCLSAADDPFQPLDGKMRSQVCFPINIF